MSMMINPNAARKAWMGLLTKAPAAQLAPSWAPSVAYASDWRCDGAWPGWGRWRTIQELAEGAVGHVFVQGRDNDKTRVLSLISRKSP